MFALRISKQANGCGSGKPDGMFIRPDSRMTDHKPNAILFSTQELANTFGTQWVKREQYLGKLFVVQGTVKQILHVVTSVSNIIEL